ncbi:MAG: hypothetical protein LBU83_09810, partial [Bacteroidales bacterium]|nr:hypothetical protein [Bacteroidales bacterium]
MKRVLFFMLTAGLLMSATAQENVFSFTKSEKIVLHEKGRFDLEIPTTSMLPTNPKGSLVDVGGWKYAGTSESYDRQTQGAVYPMTKQHDDGFIGATWTNEDNPPFQGSSTPTGGVAYTYSTDGGMTWSTPDLRVGGIPLYFPSYTQWGAHGEAILARSADSFEYNGVQILNGLVLLTRENRGVDEWNIAIVPYPEGTSPDDNYVMAYARMTTSGSNHQYIHIMSPMDATVQPYEGYSYPVFYYRTQDGGLTWDIQGLLVPEMVGQEWDVHSEYIDAITFADTHGDMVACAFIAFGNDGYVLRSRDNGDIWESAKFFDSPVGPYIDPSQYADTCYIPTQGCIALDNNGKIHVAFSVVMAMNDEDEGNTGYFSGDITSSFLSYWNEDMEPIDGDTDFVKHKIEPILMDYFDWELSDEYKLYVKSTVPELPVIGYFTTGEDHYFHIDMTTYPFWYNCYGMAGPFSFPQMGFDTDNRLHLAYLGILNGTGEGICWYNHPFYTTTSDEGETWTKTEYLVQDKINFIDKEFAYLTLAGIDNQWVRLMAQVDLYPGTAAPGFPTDNDNYFIHFSVEIEHTSNINDLEKTT